MYMQDWCNGLRVSSVDCSHIYISGFFSRPLAIECGVQYHAFVMLFSLSSVLGCAKKVAPDDVIGYLINGRKDLGNIAARV